MRRLIVPTALAVGLGLIASNGAFAATAPKPAPAKPSAAAAKDPKTEACEAQWKAQKTHTSKHKAFIKSCVAKG